MKVFGIFAIIATATAIQANFESISSVESISNVESSSDPCYRACEWWEICHGCAAATAAMEKYCGPSSLKADATERI